MKRIVYYLSILRQSAKLSLLTMLEYRVNAVLSVSRSVINLAVSLIFFEIVFAHTKSIGGWSKYQVILFYGVFLLTDAIFDFFFGANLDKLEDYISRGKFDIYLTKPVNSLFLMSMRQLRTLNVFNFIFSLLVINFSLVQMKVSLSNPAVIGFILLVISGTVIYYSLYTIIVTLAFWTTHTPFYELLDTLAGITKYPLDIFGKNWQFIFTFFLPLIFVVTVPSRYILGKFDLLEMMTPLIAGLLFIVTVKFWNFALKKYSSAG